MSLTITEREEQVWLSLALGHPIKRTAADLGVSERTVECHRGTLFKKLGCHSTIEAALYAVAYGVIGVEPLPAPVVVARKPSVMLQR